MKKIRRPWKGNEVYQLGLEKCVYAENSWEVHVIKDDNAESKQHRVHLFSILKKKEIKWNRRQ